MNFSDLGLSEELLRAVDDAGYSVSEKNYCYNPDPLQRKLAYQILNDAAKSNSVGKSCNLKVSYTCDKGKGKLTIINNYDTINIELIERIKESLHKNQILDGASKGTGSGIFKVKKMLTYELKINNSLDIEVDEDSKTFKLSITYDLAQIQKGI